MHHNDIIRYSQQVQKGRVSAAAPPPPKSLARLYRKILLGASLKCLLLNAPLPGGTQKLRCGFCPAKSFLAHP
eukprot:1143144-Pelagomonas_calceolata.AAC.3